MPPFLDSVLELIGAVVLAGGGLSLIVYQVFKHLAEKWLDARFEERLQDLRHRHERELEHLRFRINSLLDRTTKLNEREFDLLPEAWERVHSSFWSARAVTSSFQSYPDLQRMSPQQLEEFLSTCPLERWQIDELRTTPDRNDYYQLHIHWHALNETLSQLRAANIFLAKAGIFMQPELRTKFTGVMRMAFEAVEQERFNHQHKSVPRVRQKIDEFFSQGDGALLELERLVHARLWPPEKSAA